jgi:hypothetical protein
MNIPAALYTTNLSKAQGMVPETLELLELWEPSMTAADLKARVRSVGALGKATQVRVDDLVGRGFAQRFLTNDGAPAKRMQRLLHSRAPRGIMRQLILLYTCRANRILHDFIREVYWMKHATGAGEVAKQDARDFIEQAASKGRLEQRWSETMNERVTRYLLGTLVDFDLIAENRYGQRQIKPLFMLPETVNYLVHELHFQGVPDQEIHRHEDWGIFGLTPADVIAALNKCATQNHLFIQHSGAILRIEWKYKHMDEVLDAIAHG